MIDTPRRTPFPEKFPDVVIQQPHASPVRVNSHPDYAAAKAGDPEAASRLVDVMVQPAKLDQIRALLGHRQPIVVAVHAEEASGRNAIPERYAYVLARDLGLPLDDVIVQANRPQRTGKSGEYRQSVHSEFDGLVHVGRDYLVVDNNVTQGGTIADLRAYIESQGGQVIDATTLTGSRGSEILAPRAETIAALRDRFPDLERRWRATFGYDFTGLTQGEANYILRSPASGELGDRIIARAQAVTAPGVPGNRRSRGRQEGAGDDEGGGGVAASPGLPGDAGTCGAIAGASGSSILANLMAFWGLAIRAPVASGQAA